jgi:hypothetical protein
MRVILSLLYERLRQRDAVPTAGYANANVWFPDGLAHQDSGKQGVGY